MLKRYVLKLTVSEREELEQVVRTGKAAGWKIQRAQALLKCEQSVQGPSWTDEQVADAFGCTTRSPQSWRQQAVEGAPLSLLERKPRRLPGRRKLAGDQHARLTALACSKPPQGAARWTLHLLAARLVELQRVDSISYETVRRALKKTTSRRGGR
jgi:uncharacterized NAD(P)/FAD-binding protein YdhS